MAESPDDLTVKNLLETYFRVEDLQKVLKAFNLPVIGRKPELLQRVLSLINHRQYDLDFIAKVKKKIVQTYQQRVEPDPNAMAPTVHTTESRKALKRSTKQKKYSNYDSDSSYGESDSDKESSDEDLSDFIVNTDSMDSMDTQKNKSDKQKQKQKKRKRVVEPKSSSSSDENETNSSDTSGNSSDILSKYVGKPRNKRRKESEIKNKKKKKQNKRKENNSESDAKSEKTRKTYVSSSSDSDDSVVNKTKRRPKVRKSAVNIDSSDESEPQNNGNHSDSSSSSDADNDINRNINNLIEDDSSDDEIQFLEFVPASQSTIVRTDQFRSKDNSSSNTESSSESRLSDSDMETNDSTAKNAAELLRLVTNNVNAVNATTCDTSADKSVEKTPQIQTQAIDSRTGDQNTIEDLESISDNSSELELVANSVEGINKNSNPVTTETNSSNSVPVPALYKVDPTPPVVNPTPPVVSQPFVTPLLPQLPDYSSPSLYVRTPNKVMPKKYTYYKNGTPLVWEPPPQLPPHIRITIIEPKVTIEKAKQQLNVGSDEIQAIEQNLKISLLCPITNRRLALPCRSRRCHHIDCFDINAFLEINFSKKIDDWKCPKCTVTAKLEELEVDSLMKHILITTDPSVENIIFDRKGVWSPDIRRADNSVKRTNDNNVIDIDNTLEDDVIELDDDEDEPESSAALNPISVQLNRVASEIASAKSVEQNISNMIHTNREKTHKSEGNSRKELTLNQILQYINTTADNQTVRPITTITTANSVPQQRPNNQRGPIQPVRLDLRPVALRNRLPISTIGGQQIRPNITTAPAVSQAQPQRLPSFTPITTSGRITNPPTAAKPADIKFEFDSNNQISSIFCQLCNERLDAKESSEHVNSAKHKAFVANRNKPKDSDKNVSQNRPQNVSQNRPQNVSQNRPQNVSQNRPQNNNSVNTCRQSSGASVGQQLNTNRTFSRFDTNTNNYTYSQFNSNAFHPNQYMNTDQSNQYRNLMSGQAVPYNANQNYHYINTYSTYQTPTFNPQMAPPAHTATNLGPLVAHSANTIHYGAQGAQQLTHPSNAFVGNQNPTFHYNSYL